MTENRENRIRTWKCIAAALNRSERTVRDWEAEGYFRDGKDLLPVREDWEGVYIDVSALEEWKQRTDMSFRAAGAIRAQRKSA